MWPVRRLGAFAQRGRVHCAYWAMCSQLFGLFRAKRAILSLHAGWRWRAAQSESVLIHDGACHGVFLQFKAPNWFAQLTS